MRDPIYKKRRVEPYPAKFGGERINDFIVMSEGYSNTYLIETDEGDILINAGIFFEGPVHRKNYLGFSDHPVRFCVLTQGHVDHLGGVGHFREHNPEMELITTAANVEHQAYDKRLAPFRTDRSSFAFASKMMGAFQYYQEQGYTDYPSQDIPVPDVTFDDRYSFTLGGLEVELIAVPGAETNDSLIVWLPQHKTVFTGNLFGCPFGHFPNLVTIRGDRYRDALTVAHAVEVVKDLGAELLLYGHHEPVVGKELIETELDCLHKAIHHVHDEVVKGMNEGKDVETLMADIEVPAEIEVGQGYGKVNWSVRAIWENYAGWFKHKSTTELYNVPQTSVHADLLERAGGADALAARAEEKIAAGELEQAIHLTDIVRSQQPEHADAVAASRKAHELLLEGSENFWLSSWLKHQIDTLNGIDIDKDTVDRRALTEG